MLVDYETIYNDKDLQSALEIIRTTELSYHPKLLLGSSKKMCEIRAIIDQIAPTDITVLLGGESGTGKELLARSIFKQSSRKNKPFVKVLCAAIPDGLLESELFGHEKGSFTGAHASKPGKFEFAKQGTIFLDEIGEIPFSLQAKLLQVIQDREFSRIGGEEIKVDVRIIVATNRILEEEVAKGHFREDLFYRLNVVNITLPPLRERKEDIPVLIALFMEKFKKQFNKADAYISNSMVNRLIEYNWPGNIRELENIIKRIVVLGEGQILLKNSTKILSASEPPADIVYATPAGHTVTSPAHQHESALPPVSPVPFEQGEQGRVSVIKDIPRDAPQTDKSEPPVISLQDSKILLAAILSGKSLKMIAREASLQAENNAIHAILEYTRWNRKEAAKKLQISYKALLYKIKECGLEEE